jgi:hypothetical protein
MRDTPDVGNAGLIKHKPEAVFLRQMYSPTSVKWLYKLDESFTWASKHRVPEELIFKDKTGGVRLIIEPTGDITVTRGYAWNGCSPKGCIFDILFGTPEGVVHVRTERPKTYYASLVHDALYQFLRDGLPLTRRDADNIFFRLMAESDFAPRWIYWAFVRLFGRLVWSATKLKRKTRGERERVDDLVPKVALSNSALKNEGERI